MKASELRDKSIDELQKMLETAKKDLLDFQKSHAAQELANSHVIRKTRKEIAKLHTVITEKLAEVKNNDKKEDK